VRIRGSWVALLWICGIAPASVSWGGDGPATSGGGRLATSGGRSSGILEEWKLPPLAMIRMYQILLSSQDSRGCPFQPSCSHFGQEATRRYGVQGLFMTADRLLRCNGFHLERYELDPRTGKHLDPADRNVLWGTAADPGGSADPWRTGGEQRLEGSAAESPPRLSISPGSETDLYASPEGVRRFADYLYGEGDFLRAAGEYQRFLCFQGSNGPDGDPLVRDSVALRVGICYRLGGSPRLAAGQFRSLLGRPSDPLLRCEALTQLSGIYWDLHRPEAAVAEIDSLCQRSPSLCDTCPGPILRGTSHLLAGSWAKARIDLNQASAAGGGEWRSKLAALRAVADEGCAASRKSATKAAILSALVPGAGRIYAGNSLDGVLSLGTILLIGWQSASGFHDHGSRSIKGWIYGALGFGFYGGNIYGSAMAARIHNRATDERLIESTRGIIQERAP